MEWPPECRKRDLMYLRNASGHTVLTLASEQGDKFVFEHTLEHMVQVKWLFGPVGCCTIPLDQLDTLAKRDLSLSRSPPSDEEMLFRTCSTVILSENCENLATNQTFIQIQEKKWAQWASHVYWQSLGISLLFIISFYVLGMEWIEFTHSNKLLNNAERDITLLVVLERIVFGMSVLQALILGLDIGAAMKAEQTYNRQVIQDARDRIDQRLREEIAANDGNPEDVEARTEPFRKLDRLQVVTNGAKRRVTVITQYVYCQVIALALVVAHYIMFELEGSGSRHAPFLLAIASPFAHLSLFRYSCGTKSLGYLLIIIKRAMQGDIPTFLQVLGVLVLGFGLGLHIMEVDVNDENPNGDVFAMFLDLYRVTLGEKPYWSKRETTIYPWIVFMFYITFSLLSSVVLVRLLISMFNDTYAQAKKCAEAVWRIERGIFILTQERRLLFLINNIIFWNPYLSHKLRKKLWIGDTWENELAQPGNFEMTTVQNWHPEVCNGGQPSSLNVIQLRDLRMSELWRRALAAGVTPDELADALDTDNPNDTIVRLMLRYSSAKSGDQKYGAEQIDFLDGLRRLRCDC